MRQARYLRATGPVRVLRGKLGAGPLCCERAAKLRVDLAVSSSGITALRPIVEYTPDRLPIPEPRDLLTASILARDLSVPCAVLAPRTESGSRPCVDFFDIVVTFVNAWE